MMQRQRLPRLPRSGAIGVEPARDDLRSSGNAPQFGLEPRRILARRMARPGMAQSELDQLPARWLVLGACLLYDGPQNFAVAFRRDRQPVLEIPGPKTS